MALSKSQIKKIEKYQKYYVLLPFGEIQGYLAYHYISFNTIEHYEIFVLDEETIKSIIKKQPAKGYFTIYEPQFKYNTPQEIGKIVERNDIKSINKISNFKMVYKKESKDNIMINEYNW